MGPLEITGADRLALGLATGVLFGFILQKAQVTRYDKIVGFFRLTDLTVLKVLLSAIATGMVAVYLLHDLGLANLHVKPTVLGANLVGGLVFGAGMLLLGFCPGTCVAAAGEGQADPLLRGVLGILIGAFVHAELYAYLQTTPLASGAYGKLTVPGLLDLSPWAVVVPVATMLWLFALWADRLERAKP